ncbi:unnamed protein product [Heterosigma akashiwo]
MAPLRAPLGVGRRSPRPPGAQQAGATPLARPGGRAAQGGGQQGILRFYTDEAPGLKIGPTAVLFFSVSFIGVVVLLHIWGKFR